MTHPGNDTIAAVATARGAGGIGIVRISGQTALTVAGRIFVGRGGRRLADAPPFQLTLGSVRDPLSGEEIDECLAVWMPEGRSYTAEPTVELQTHGGSGVPDAVLCAALDAGARLAAPGEFTKRAFLAGRLDLSQAEAVADLIAAESDAARRLALLHLRGGLGVEISALRALLLDLIAGTEAVLDFADEEDINSEDLLAAALASAIADIRSLILRGESVAAHLSKTKIVVAGCPNSGKSSLFNVLYGQERMIVSPQAGTTRDYVEAACLLGEFAVVLVDTAGLREGAGVVEAEGVRRSRQQILEADVLVLLVDGSVSIDEEDLQLLKGYADRSPLLVISKADLPRKLDLGVLREHFPSSAFHVLSSNTGEGCRELVEALRHNLRGQLATPVPAPNVRHRAALRRAAGHLEDALRAAGSQRVALDQVAADLRSALAAVGEITGETADEEILERIFSAFCIGK